MSVSYNGTLVTSIVVNDTVISTPKAYYTQSELDSIATAVSQKSGGGAVSNSTVSGIINDIGNLDNAIELFIGGFNEDFLLNLTRSQFDTYASSMVGKNITLTHSVKTIPWIIIGYNHDSTSYTFDLWSSISMYDSQTFGSSQTYSSSTVRTTINNMVSGFSSNIQSRLQTMSVSSNGSTLNDKVKLLSLTEMGITSGNYHPGVEGNTYSNYFTTGGSTTQTYADLIRNNSSGTAVAYWTRSRNTSNTSYVWRILGNGGVGNYGYTSSFSLLPAIRIGIAS